MNPRYVNTTPGTRDYYMGIPIAERGPLRPVSEMDVRKWATLLFVCLWFLSWTWVPRAVEEAWNKASSADGRRALFQLAPRGARTCVRLRRVGSNWSRRPNWLFLTIILLSGDIHPNPRPPATYPCVSSNEPVCDEGIQCDMSVIDGATYPSSCAHVRNPL